MPIKSASSQDTVMHVPKTEELFFCPLLVRSKVARFGVYPRQVSIVSSRSLQTD